MNRAILLFTLVVGVVSLLAAEEKPAADRPSARKPNVLIIVGDDMGFADVGVNGCKDIPTPYIDSIARNGVRCTNGYVSGPYCSPTRAALLTGRYQQRFGHEFNPGPAGGGPGFGITTKEKTLAEHFSAAGYKTGWVGKWHLGTREGTRPIQRGFQETYGFLGGAHSYLAGKAAAANDPILRNDKPTAEPDYLTDGFGAEAVAFIDRHRSEPFFLYLAFNAVHVPMHATEKYLKRFESISDPRRRTYAAMMSAMDDAIGQVLAKLREGGLDEQTIVFFFSDNGGPPANASDNGPLRGRKAQTWEGGIHVPWLVQWKGHLPVGTTYERPVIQIDIAPTAFAACELDKPASAHWEGTNLLPYLRGEKADAPHDALYWRFGQQMAVRAGDWKLVESPGSMGRELFNLKDDPGEKTNLAASQPDKAKELEAVWDRWNADNVAPAWGAPGKAAAKTGAKAAARKAARKAKALGGNVK
jgi:arylsulfatase A-like enzyme